LAEAVGGERLVTSNNPFAQDTGAPLQGKEHVLFPSHIDTDSPPESFLRPNHPTVFSHEPKATDYASPNELIGLPSQQVGYGGHHDKGGAFQMPAPEGLAGFHHPLGNLPPKTQGGVPAVAQRNSDFALAAAVDFLQHNHSRSQQPVDYQPPSRSTGFFPAQNGLTPLAPVPPVHQDTLFSESLPRYESNVVDSLFGLPHSQTTNEDAALVAGLNGLGLGPSRDGELFWGNGLQDSRGGFRQ
jgi:hypothetical protein